MPSNKEIAGWLREAGDTLYAVDFISNGYLSNKSIKDDARIAMGRAALVEQMRCEECRWWDGLYHHCKRLKPEGIPDGSGYVSWCGPQFYCCHWEGRE